MKRTIVIGWLLCAAMLTFSATSCEKPQNEQDPDQDAGADHGPDENPEKTAQFELKAENITQTRARLTYTPKFEGTYMSGVMSWKTFEEEYQCDVEVMRDQDLAWYEYLADNYGGVWTDYLPQDVRSGVFTATAQQLGWCLQWETDYIMYAFGINLDGTVTTDVEYVKFRTLAKESRNLSFDIKIVETYSDGVDATIFPSNENDSYFVSIQRASYVEWWTDPANGVTEDDMIYELVESRFAEDQLDEYLYRGKSDLTPEDYRLSRADADHYLIVFGYEDGPTTGVTLVKFRTKPKE